MEVSKYLQTFFIVGPAIGYMLGGYFLTIYTDFDQKGNILNLDSDSNLWVGAWWLGFMLSFATSIICAILVRCVILVIYVMCAMHSVRVCM